MKKSKTLIAIALIASMMTSLSACSDKKTPTSTDDLTTSATETTESAESAKPTEASVEETTEETTVETSKKEAFTPPTVGPSASILIAEFLDEIEDFPCIYEDPVTGGTLTVLHHSSGSTAYTDFRYDSSAKNVYLTISFDTDHRWALDGALSLKYPGNKEKSYSFGSFYSDKMEDMCFNINDDSYKLIVSTLGNRVYSDSGDCDKEAIAHDTQLLYAKFIDVCNRVFQEYDSEFDMANYGFTVSERTTSLDVTEKLYCEETEDTTETTETSVGETTEED